MEKAEHLKMSVIHDFWYFVMSLYKDALDCFSDIFCQTDNREATIFALDIRFRLLC